MSYGDPSPAHTNALAQISDARQRALTAIGEIRKREISTPHPNLASASGDTEGLPVLATQAAHDYLMQLRPYRSASRKWDVDLGVIQLPTEMPRGASKRRGRDSRSPLYLCRQPEVPVRGANDLLAALNSTIYYSAAKPPNSTTTRPTAYQIRPPSFEGRYYVTRETHRDIKAGALSPDEVVEMDLHEGRVGDAEQSSGYTPAVVNVDPSGNSRGSRQEVRGYKFVLPPDDLQSVVETVDDVASEMDMLAEIKAPDFDADGRGAVGP